MAPNTAMSTLRGKPACIGRPPHGFASCSFRKRESTTYYSKLAPITAFVGAPRMTVKTVTRNRFARASDHSLVVAARRRIRDTGDATMNTTLNPEGSDLSPYLPDEHGLFFVYHFTAEGARTKDPAATHWTWRSYQLPTCAPATRSPPSRLCRRRCAMPSCRSAMAAISTSRATGSMATCRACATTIRRRRAGSAISVSRSTTRC